MVRSFRDRKTAALFEGKVLKGVPADLVRVARRKLAMVNRATKLDDLRYPPGNMLEALSKGRKGQHSIRVNDQFRICFRWTDAGPEDVEFADYP